MLERNEQLILPGAGVLATERMIARRPPRRRRAASTRPPTPPPLKPGDYIRSPARSSARWHRVIRCYWRRPRPFGGRAGKGAARRGRIRVVIPGTWVVVLSRSRQSRQLGLSRFQRLELATLEAIGIEIRQAPARGRA